MINYNVTSLLTIAAKLQRLISDANIEILNLYDFN